MLCFGFVANTLMLHIFKAFSQSASLEWTGYGKRQSRAYPRPHDTMVRRKTWRTWSSKASIPQRLAGHQSADGRSLCIATFIIFTCKSVLTSAQEFSHVRSSSCPSHPAGAGRQATGSVERKLTGTQHLKQIQQIITEDKLHN